MRALAGMLATRDRPIADLLLSHASDQRWEPVDQPNISKGAEITSRDIGTAFAD
jgi:hypothetical protein